MSHLIFPVFRTPVKTPKPRTSGESLAREFDKLDQLAAAAGIASLSTFSDQREVPADYDGPPWELDEVMGPCDAWFSASAGQSALAALAQLIRKDRKAARRLDAPDELADELDDLARVLAPAAKAGIEFRLEMSH